MKENLTISISKATSGALDGLYSPEEKMSLFGE